MISKVNCAFQNCDHFSIDLDLYFTFKFLFHLLTKTKQMNFFPKLSISATTFICKKEEDSITSNKINLTTFPPPAGAKWCPEDFMKYLETYSQSSDWDTEEHHPLNISSVTDKLLMVLFFTFLLSKARNFHCFINTAAS